MVTATDGDNGGWFRNHEMSSNFWGFYRNLLDQARSDTAKVLPTFIDDYLDKYGAYGEVHVETGAWNTGWHHGRGFVQWTGSQPQRDALARAAQISKLVHDTRWHAGERQVSDPEFHRLADDALFYLLRAETSCNYYWGEAWIPRAHQDLDASQECIDQAILRLSQP